MLYSWLFFLKRKVLLSLYIGSFPNCFFFFYHCFDCFTLWPFKDMICVVYISILHPQYKVQYFKIRIDTQERLESISKKKKKKMSEQSNIKWLQMLSVHISNINIQEKVFIILEFHHICFPIRHILGYGWPQLIQIFCPTCNSLYEEKKWIITF